MNAKLFEVNVVLFNWKRTIFRVCKTSRTLFFLTTLVEKL